MQDKIMNAFSEQTKNMYAPMRKLNALMVENMEKMTEFQIEALKSYSKMGVNQLKNAAEVKDAESVRDFTAAQTELMSTLSKKVLEDAKSMADMTMEFKQEIEKIVEESRASVTAATTAEPEAKTAEKRSTRSTTGAAS
ncbi:phasin family protein [Oceanospirillum multiglobuliferum]|uniref:Phasin family protein n=1 Tax=Oceanospirillum multiglobuliferum TaxID=64969 RepID=A0A1T4N1H4_9GAMM|nr:phasin family protein [Oceanospirillum multiglobuliferum]OPX55801.1 phasin family protein [Oceanospirillum multiglobuliferum]SJZ72956.1 phasin family protein [Oceanospirillum multiglobuliferum]